MNNFVRKVRTAARKKNMKIVLPEGTDERILQATEVIVSEKIARIVLLGPPRTIKAKAKKLKLKIDWDKIEIHDPLKSKLSEKYTEELFKLRKEKGLTRKQAKELLKDVDYFGTMMVQLDDADGMVTGAAFNTAHSVRPALQIIKTKEKFHKVSGMFFMTLENKVLLFADCAITIEPNSYELVQIAIDSAETAKRFGIKPKIAMLSFSTNGSAQHPTVDKVREAVSMIRDQRPDLIVDGEIQVDAAIVPSVAKRKCPGSPLKGDANVLIFPSLEAANIAYKLVERLAKAKAIGPLLQGLRKPVNKLSRGCNYKDIINVVTFTAFEAD